VLLIFSWSQATVPIGKTVVLTSENRHKGSSALPQEFGGEWRKDEPVRDFPSVLWVSFGILPLLFSDIYPQWFCIWKKGRKKTEVELANPFQLGKWPLKVNGGGTVGGSLVSFQSQTFLNTLLRLLRPPYGIGQAIICSSCRLFYLSSSSSFFPRLISAVADWMSTILPHMVWP